MHQVTEGSSLLDLADWRRRVAEMWFDWRSGCQTDPGAATAMLRATRDTLLRTHPQSPLPERDRERFGGVPTWPYDPAWRLRAPLVLDAGSEPGPAPLPWTAPSTVEMRRIGHVDLNGPLAGQRLPVFWLEGYTGGLFIPFRDLTSGHETYGAGRYLIDTAKSADHGRDTLTGDLVLDFNVVYHPSCVFDTRWTCPLAPPGSRLDAAVRVGDRLPVAA
ncbi:MAG TPA: DUF1684 domain-containing protein [Candidatus Limnocylindrales bacterium]